MSTRNLTTLRIDIAEIKATAATKADIGSLSAYIAKTKTAIIVRLIAVIVLAQIVPAFVGLFFK